MKVGDLVKHKTTKELGIITKVLHGKVSDVSLAYVRRFNGSSFPHPFSILEVVNESG
tara:strand:+ start:11240 stop:11410 length:171 start_codon:yes stop_codon:yes gene_type:complete